MVSVARRALSSVVVPRTVVPSRKVTAPVAVPAPGVRTLTVAVNVTAWPAGADVFEDVTMVLVAALPMILVTAGEVLPLKFASPA